MSTGVTSWSKQVHVHVPSSLVHEQRVIRKSDTFLQTTPTQLCLQVHFVSTALKRLLYKIVLSKCILNRFYPSRCIFAHRCNAIISQLIRKWRKQTARGVLGMSKIKPANHPSSGRVCTTEINLSYKYAWHFPLFLSPVWICHNFIVI